MKFDKDKIKEASIKEGDFDMDNELDFEDDTMLGDDYVDPMANYAEVEMTVAEPTKVTDVDGSVVIVSPGDIVTIKSESIKRIKN